MTAAVAEAMVSWFAGLNVEPSQLSTTKTDLTIDELDGWTNPPGSALAPTTICWVERHLTREVSAS